MHLGEMSTVSLFLHDADTGSTVCIRSDKASSQLMGGDSLPECTLPEYQNAVAAAMQAVCTTKKSARCGFVVRAHDMTERYILMRMRYVSEENGKFIVLAQAEDAYSQYREIHMWEDPRGHREVSAVRESSGFRAAIRQYRQVEDRARRDPLTNIYNRQTAETMYAELSDKRPGMLHALIVVDIDDFKSINDTYGHLCGDCILKRVADKLSSFFRSGDIAARVGGDEFVVLMANIPDRQAVLNKCRALCEEINSITSEREGLRCSISVGAAITDGSESFKSVYARADSAMYSSKRSGKNKAEAAE